MKKLVSVAAALVFSASVAMADTASTDNNQAQVQQPSNGVMQQAQPNAADKHHKKDDQKSNNMMMTTAAKKKVKANKTHKKAATNTASPAKPVADNKA